MYWKEHILQTNYLYIYIYKIYLSPLHFIIDQVFLKSSTFIAFSGSNCSSNCNKDIWLNANKKVEMHKKIYFKIQNN